MTGFRAALCLALLSVPACGDLVGYPIRHRPTSPGEPLAPVYPGSVPRPSTGPAADGAVPSADLYPPPTPTEGCRWPQGTNLASFCSGATPRAVTDNRELALDGVRAKGSVPVFHFILADGPRQLLADLAVTAPPGPGRFDLSAESPEWAARVYTVLCDPDLSCTSPEDWLSVAKGDEVQGWVELDGANRAALCLAVVRGAHHPAASALPCTAVLYSPTIPAE